MGLLNHNAGKQCLLELDNILNKLSVPHFLMQGTALGAYRDRGFVPTEKDIDIGVLQEHLQPKAELILCTLMLHGFDIEAYVMPFTKPRTLIAFKTYDGHLAKADIVGMARWKDKRFTCTPIKDHCMDTPYALVHESNMMEQYRDITLFHRVFKIPLDIKTYLQREYGEDWRTPQDDHVSRTRVYDYLNLENIPHDFLETYCTTYNRQTDNRLSQHQSTS